jgi:hypothetical protein
MKWEFADECLVAKAGQAALQVQSNSRAASYIGKESVPDPARESF